MLVEEAHSIRQRDRKHNRAAEGWRKGGHRGGDERSDVNVNVNSTA